MFHSTPQMAPSWGVSEPTSLSLSLVASDPEPQGQMLSDAHFPVPFPGTLGLSAVHMP